MRGRYAPTGSCLRALVAAAFVGLIARSTAGQTGENVLVVANKASSQSVELAEYYASKRHIPRDQLIALQLPLVEEIPRFLYEVQIERPLSLWLTTHDAQDRVLYIVLTKGVPLRVAGSGGRNGTMASVDSELTLLYRKFARTPVAQAGSTRNPYFLGVAPISDAKPFTHEGQDIYLVARLDGFTFADAKALVDRGGTASAHGRILLDERSELIASEGNRWLQKAAAALKGLSGWSDRVVLDTGANVLHDESDVFGYYSWGSNDPAISERHLHLRFVPGALAAMFVSTDGRTFKEPPENWNVGRYNFSGTSQSLMGDLIHDGVTGVAGHVAEPYLDATIRPDILFPAYVSGFNLVESFYLAMPYVSWQTIVVGDPLCAPTRTKPLTASQIDRGIDAATELPAFLSRRRLDVLATTGANPAAARLYLKAERRLAKQNVPDAQAALEQATALDDKLVPAQLLLASVYEGTRRWDAAIARYRRVIALDPRQPMALNNLAYALAVHGASPAEALPIAKRAFEASKTDPNIADTLGWVYHLNGDDASAEPFVVGAAAAALSGPETRLHAAIVLAANGKLQNAARMLELVLTMDRSYEQREEVRQLRARIGTAQR